MTYGVEIRTLARSAYERGLSSRAVADIVGVSQPTVSEWMRCEGKNRRCRRRAEKFNERYFENIDSEGKAYFLGLLMADGCVLDPRGAMKSSAIILKLHEKDGEIIRAFAKELGFEGHISLTCKKYMRLCVTSNMMAGDLKSKGIIPRKTHKEIEVECGMFQRHFWRGVVDGDGCISVCKGKNGIKYPGLWLVGSHGICDSFKRRFKLDTKILARPGCFCIVARCGFAKRIIEELYSNCEFTIKRKLEKAVEVMNGTYRA